MEEIHPLSYLHDHATAMRMENLRGTEGDYTGSGWLSRHDGLFLLWLRIHLQTVCRELSGPDKAILRHRLDNRRVRDHGLSLLPLSHCQHELAINLYPVPVAAHTRTAGIPDDI